MEHRVPIYVVGSKHKSVVQYNAVLSYLVLFCMYVASDVSRGTLQANATTHHNRVGTELLHIPSVKTPASCKSIYLQLDILILGLSI